MSAADALTAFQKPFVITRRTDGGYTNGRHNAPTTATINIDAVVQPLRGRSADLERLPEGRTSDDARIVYTITALQPVAPGYMPDLIAIDGVPYELFHFENWQGSFYKALFLRTVLEG